MSISKQMSHWFSNEVQEALLVETLGTYVFYGKTLRSEAKCFLIFYLKKTKLKDNKILAASLRSLEQVELAIHAGSRDADYSCKSF